MAPGHPKTILQNIIWPSCLLDDYMCYKLGFYLMSLVVEGSIKKIKFSSSLSLFSYLKTIGWEPILIKLFYGGKPELLGAIGEQVFY